MSRGLLRSLLSIGVLALVALLALAAEEAPSADKDEPAEATVLEAPHDEPKTEQLPEFDQEAIVSQQRARLGKIKRDLRLVMYPAESAHFLLFSDLDSRVRNAVLIWLEGLRSKVITELGLDAKERLWDGKCLAVVFTRQEFLAAFAAKFDHHDVKRPRGYFVLEGRRANEPRLVHIAAYQPIRGGNQALREVLIHETTHAIVELYKTSAPLPLWVHEGLAEYMTVLMDPTLRPRKQAPAFEAATADPYVSIRSIFTRKFPASDITAYSVSMSLVECLHRIEPAGVLRFVELMKKGVEPEEALGQAYPGLDHAELEHRWRRFCMKFYRPPVPEEAGP